VPSRQALSAAAALIVVGACGWPPAGNRAQAEPAPASAADRPGISGFRADAWFLPDDELLGFVAISAGPFVMGSDPAIDTLAYDNELWEGAQGPGTVEVPTFYIGRYEVTVAQYRAFVHATGYQVAPQTLEAPPDHPVTSVSWPDALAYCRWLEAALREWPHTPPALSGALREGFRVGLPSEAEWEKGARGTDGRIYPWGSEPQPKRANYGGVGTMPVGSFECPDCPFGLRDMSGNVWELTRSPYEPYPYDPTDDRDHLEGDALFVMRGGHFGDAVRNVRAAVRGGVDPGARRPFIGFRVVLSRF
jgi:formylglycine-generating enzyme required for sulfatase activity